MSRDPDGLFDWRISGVFTIQDEIRAWEKRRLGEKAWTSAAMGLGRMHEKWMAQVDRFRRAGRRWRGKRPTGTREMRLSAAFS
jgi:hypothetical protein